MDTFRNSRRAEAVIVAASPSDLARRGADIFWREAVACVAEYGRFTAAVSGGSTPRAMYRLLATAPFYEGIPWLHTHLFWVDERLVAYDDTASNYGAARGDFLSAVAIPPRQIHPMPVDKRPADAALSYSRELDSVFQTGGKSEPVFDLVILGIGTDGHTASLFPDASFSSPEGRLKARADNRWVLAVSGGEPAVDRLTLNYPVLNHARHVVMMASGSAKAAIVARAMGRQDDSLPAMRIRPQGGRLTWLIDRKAASRLPPDKAPS